MVQVSKHPIHGVTCNGKSVQLSISAGNPDGKTCWAMCLGSYWS